jgi:Cytochrome P460
VTLACAVGLTAIDSDSPTQQAKLPEEVRSYRDWPQLLKSPHQVPIELWIRCVAPTAADWASARQKYGPHSERYIRVYGNQATANAVAVAKAQPLPVGAVLVKEKFLGSPHGAPEGVAFLIKRGPGAFPEAGGWEFGYFPDAGDPRLTQQACAACHRSAAAADFVFGKYPR